MASEADDWTIPAKSGATASADDWTVPATDASIPQLDKSGRVIPKKPTEEVKEKGGGILENIQGAGETALSGASGLIKGALGPLGAIFGGIPASIVSGEFGTPQGAARVEQGAEEARGVPVYEPKTKTGQAGVQALGRGMESLTPLLGMAPQLGQAGAAISRAAPALAAKVPSGIAGSVGRGVDVLRGNPAKALQVEAIQGMKGELGQAAEGTGRAADIAGETAMSAQADAASATAQRAKLDSLLSAPRETVTRGDLGEHARNTFVMKIKAAEKVTTDNARTNYQAAKTEGLAMDARGDFIDPQKALAPVQKMIDEAGHIPGVSVKGMDMIRSMKGSSAEGVSPPRTFTDASGKKLFETQAAPEVPAKPLTFAELQNTVRWLEDVADGKIDGFEPYKMPAGAAARALKAELRDKNPAYKKAIDDYKRDKAALDAVETRIGDVILERQGGYEGESYAKTDATKIPGNIFKSPNNIQIYEDGLAGGPHATPEARAHAQQQIADMALKYFEEETRTMAPENVPPYLESQGVVDVARKFPDVGRVVGTRAESITGLKGISEKLGEKATVSGDMATAEANKSADLKASAQDMKTAMENADKLAAKGHPTAQSDAVKAYKKIFDDAYDGGKGVISQKAYDAMQNVASRLSSAEAKTAYWRRIAKIAAGTGFAAAVGSGVSHYVTGH